MLRDAHAPIGARAPQHGDLCTGVRGCDSVFAGASGRREMPRRVIGQLGWVDAELAKRGARRPDDLAKIGALIDWQPFERLLAGVNSAAKGEASYPPLMMFKVLLLQRWYT